jgi:2-polyprenyl-3-methyl-5-hydroxy-6-metoxy-1,4-benzoquinol methylase
MHDYPDVSWPEWGSEPKSNRTLSDNGHKGEVLADREDYAVIKCSPCILNHVIPLPLEEYLTKYYQSQFYQKMHPDYIKRYEKDEKWWMLQHNTMLSLIALYGKIGTVLDIGCGPGLFMKAAREHTKKVIGIEPAPKTARYAEIKTGCHVYTGTLKEFWKESDWNDAPEEFDVVHAYEVLEHARCPESMLQRIYGLTKQDGILSITVPNDWNPLQLEVCKKFNMKEWWVAPPEHLNYFTPKTLSLLLRRSGFEVVDMFGTYPLEQFILEGKNYIGNDKLGRECHKERMKWELNQYKYGTIDNVIGFYRASMQVDRVGREIRVIAKKI